MVFSGNLPGSGIARLYGGSGQLRLTYIHYHV